jgi:hypothetical protein
MEPLTPDQARVLRDAVRARASYLHRVRIRMYQPGAQRGDRLYDMFGATEDALAGIRSVAAAAAGVS